MTEMIRNRNLSFPHHYSIEFIDALSKMPAGREIREVFFGSKISVNQAKLLIKVVPAKGLPWIGIFGPGYESPRAITGVYSCPHHEEICVVVQGEGYIISVIDPSMSSLIGVFPILEVHVLLEEQLLLFVNFTHIVAYGVKGIAWSTERLSWDGLKVVKITSRFIEGIAWDAPSEQEVGFTVDLKTGEHTGGSSPDHYLKEGVA